MGCQELLEALDVEIESAITAAAARMRSARPGIHCGCQYVTFGLLAFRARLRACAGDCRRPAEWR
eukprot:2598890-Pyramimonas_sp.AAC.1